MNKGKLEIIEDFFLNSKSTYNSDYINEEIRKCKVRLFYWLLRKEKQNLSEIDVELGFWLVKDPAIQNILETQTKKDFLKKLKETKKCDCDKAWGENEPCPRHGWEEISKVSCACDARDAHECYIIRYPVPDDGIYPMSAECECSCHQQNIGYADEETSDVPLGPPDLSDIEKKLKPFFNA